MFCRNCGKELTGSPEICLGCGARPLQGTDFCQHCGAPTTPLTEICVNCGARVSRAGAHALLASRWARLGAAVVDWLLYAPGYIVVVVAAPSFLPVGYVWYIGLFVLQCVLLTQSGQTIGKKALRIRIVKVDTGENGGFVPNVLLRMIVNGIISWVTCGVYGIVDTLFIFREDRRCIHDLIAGTHVVEE